MRQWSAILVAIVVGCMLLVPATQAGDKTHHCFGIGAHYWKTLDNIDVRDGEVEESGLAYSLVYQLRPRGIMFFGLEVEAMPDDFVSTDDPVYAPAAYIFLGAGIYAGLGVGTYIGDDDRLEEIFYNLRIGLDIDILPFLSAGINANYRVNDWEGVESAGDDIDTDTVTLGAMVKLEI